MSLKPCRTRAWSSVSRIFMNSISIRSRGRRLRETDRDSCAFARLAAPGHFSAEQGGSLAHSQKADGLGVVNLRFGYAASIILDLEFQPAVVFREAHFDPRRAGMADNIRQRFLKYP